MSSRPRKPLSPEAQALLSALPTRRGLLRGAAAGGALALTGGALAACGTKPKGRSGAQASAGPICSTPDASATERKLVFSNWVQYLDTDDKDAKKHPTLDAFTAKTGIAVTYQEDINDNDEFLGKIRTQLGACQTIGRDIVVFTDWMAAKFVNLGFAQKFEPTKVATFQKNLLPSLQHRAFDKDMVFAAPWQSGLTGVAYNAKVAKEIKSVDDLFTRPDLKGKVTFLTEMNDTVGLALLALGKDPANFTEADFDAAIDKIKKAVADGQIRRFTGNDYKDDLAKGDIAACIAWSGDVIQLSADNDKIHFVIPEEGLMIWSDNMMIPATSNHASNAMALIDYYYDPKVAAQVADWVNYICPVAGAKEAMKDVDPDQVDNPLIFPDDATLAKTHPFMTLADNVRKAYEAKFQAVTGA